MYTIQGFTNFDLYQIVNIFLPLFIQSLTSSDLDPEQIQSRSKVQPLLYQPQYLDLMLIKTTSTYFHGLAGKNACQNLDEIQKPVARSVVKFLTKSRCRSTLDENFLAISVHSLCTVMSVWQILYLDQLQLYHSDLIFLFTGGFTVRANSFTPLIFCQDAPKM